MRVHALSSLAVGALSALIIAGCSDYTEPASSGVPQFPPPVSGPVAPSADPAAPDPFADLTERGNVVAQATCDAWSGVSRIEDFGAAQTKVREEHGDDIDLMRYANPPMTERCPVTMARMQAMISAEGAN